MRPRSATTWPRSGSLMWQQVPPPPHGARRRRSALPVLPAGPVLRVRDRRTASRSGSRGCRTIPRRASTGSARRPPGTALRLPDRGGTGPGTFESTLYRAHRRALSDPASSRRASSTRCWGSFRPTGPRLFGVERPAGIFLFGTESLGRDMFSRTICAARISLSIGLVGVAISRSPSGSPWVAFRATSAGGIDTFIQRLIEFIISIPTIPLWMALAAALPREWSVLQVYFGIVIILSWCAGAHWRGWCAASCWSCGSTTSPWRRASPGCARARSSCATCCRRSPAILIVHLTWRFRRSCSPRPR